MTAKPVRYVSRRKAAEHLSAQGVPVTHWALAMLASAGEGPPYRLIQNRALYQVCDLNAWIKAHPVLPARRVGQIRKSVREREQAVA